MNLLRSIKDILECFIMLQNVLCLEVSMFRVIVSCQYPRVQGIKSKSEEVRGSSRGMSELEGPLRD